MSVWWAGHNLCGLAGTAWKRDMGPPSCRSNTCRRCYRGQVHCVLGCGQGRRPCWTDPWLPRLAIRIWNILREVEMYPLDLALDSVSVWCCCKPITTWWFSVFVPVAEHWTSSLLSLLNQSTCVLWTRRRHLHGNCCLPCTGPQWRACSPTV